MNLLDQFLAVIAPHECLGCNAQGSLLCRSCTTGLPAAVERCYRCHKFSPDFQTCPACRKVSRLRRLQAARCYQGIAKDLVWRLKFAGAQAAVGPMVQQMLPCLESVAAAVVVPVPTASIRRRRRGYDQATLLARELAYSRRLPLVDCLARLTQVQQHGAKRSQRLKQLSRAFRVTKPRLVSGKHIILVDDVVTTGATLEAAATALKAAGALRIDAVVFAQA